MRPRSFVTSLLFAAVGAVLLAGCSADDLKKKAEEAAKKAEEEAKKKAEEAKKQAEEDAKKKADQLAEDLRKAKEKGSGIIPTGGVTGSAGTTGPLEQKGVFTIEPGGSGRAYFPLPYARAPVVSVRGKIGNKRDVEVSEVTAAGFKCKNNEKDLFFGTRDLEFTAQGVPDEAQGSTPFEQKGAFQAPRKASGEVKFPVAYASPPNVELGVELGLHKVVITETTRTGFKWKDVSNEDFPFPYKMTWRARGVKGK
jgi:hypothetical protein